MSPESAHAPCCICSRRILAKEVVGPIDAANLKKAHALIDSGKTIGKLVLEGWPR